MVCPADHCTFVKTMARGSPTDIHLEYSRGGPLSTPCLSSLSQPRLRASTPAPSPGLTPPLSERMRWEDVYISQRSAKRVWWCVLCHQCHWWDAGWGLLRWEGTSCPGHRRVQCSQGTTEMDRPTALTSSRQEVGGWYGCHTVPQSMVFEVRPTRACVPLMLCDLEHVTSPFCASISSVVKWGR